MRIRTRVKIGGALTICILLAYGALLLYLDRAMTNLADEAKEANEIVSKIIMLRTLNTDYLLYRTERAQRQWSAVYAEILQLLDQPEYRVLQSEYGIGDAPAKLKLIGDIFARMLVLREVPGGGNPEAGTTGELQNRLSTQLLLAAQDLVTRFISLTEEINKKLISTQRLISSLDILALLIIGALLIGNMVFLQRAVVKPVLKLHEGAEIIGAGNLEHKVGIDSRDEVGQLSRAFDEMTANLRGRTEELRKQAKLLDLAHDAILVRELDSKIVFWSRGAEETYGWQKEKALGLMTHALLKTKFPISKEDIDRELLQKGGWEGELVHTTADGSVVTVTSRQVLQKNEEGVPVAILEINRDITERKRVEEEIQRLNEDLERRVKERTAQLETANRDLERSNRELEEFAYISSHDLQEPLRQVANFSEVLAKEYQDHLDERALRYFGYITLGAKRMQSLINDLLSYSRVDQAEIPKVPASLEDILKATLNDLQTLIRGSGADISFDPLPTLKVHPNQMGLLLQNLIANAIKFRSEQPPRIHLSARQEGDEWLISIRDNGIGFDQRYSEHIFKVFKRMHSQEKFPGTGIGLAICKKIVERHGGRIWAESQPGHGATFYFTIPA